MKPKTKNLLVAFIFVAAIVGGILFVVLAGKSSSSGGGGKGNGGGGKPIHHNSPPSGAEAQKFLNIHNYYRQRSGLSPLSWSEELANAAQGWSDYLVTENCSFHHPGTSQNCKNYLGTASCHEGGWGQNLTKSWGSDTGICKAVQGWYAECPQFNGSFSESAGHYSQLMAPSTTDVGCGIGTCQSGASIYTCTYNPPGNVTGEFGDIPTKCMPANCPSNCSC